MKGSLSEEELWQYSRQIGLGEIGLEGQAKLKQSHVLVAGVGGLGTPIAYQLAAMGVGHLRIVDRDVVSLTDLHRQYLYDFDSVGLPKVEVAALKLSALNPRLKVEPIPTCIKPWNARQLLKGIDVVVDGLDSVETRYLVNQACVERRTPYVHGGAIQSMGNVTTIIPKRTACLECFYPNLRDNDLPKCAVVGVYTPAIGIVGSIQASEAVRLLVGREPRLVNRLLFIDASTLSFDEISIDRNQQCHVCGDAAEEPCTPLSEKRVEEQCSRDGRRTLIICPERWLEIDLTAAEDHLCQFGYRLNKRGKLGVTLSNQEGSSVSLLKTGVTILQTPPTVERSDAHRIAASLHNTILDKGLKREGGYPP